MSFRKIPSIISSQHNNHNNKNYGQYFVSTYDEPGSVLSTSYTLPSISVQTFASIFSPLTLLGIIERALHWNSEYLDPVPDLIIRWLCDLRK